MSYGQGGYGQGGYGQGGYGQGQGGYGGNSNPYGQAAGNPYGGSGGGYGQSNPYGQQSSYSQQRPAQSNPYGQQSSYNQQPQAAPAPQAYGSGGGGYGSQPAYSDNIPMNTMNGDTPKYGGSNDNMTPEQLRDEVKAIDGLVKKINADLAELIGHHARAKDTVDGNAATNPVLKQVDDTSSDIMRDTRKATDDLRRLKGRRNAGNDMVAPQITRVDRNLKSAIQAYQKADQQYQNDLREQLRRQYRIVRPEATDSEVNEAIETTNTQIFSQALMQSDRRGQAQSTLSAVKNRHAAIQKIEREVLQLAEMFEQMNNIIITQEAQVQQIDQQATTVEQDVSGANVELAGAVTKARAARKKKWICLGIVVAIILIIVIVILAWGYGSGTFNNKKSSS